MRYAIVFSQKDPVGRNVFELFQERLNLEEQKIENKNIIFSGYSRKYDSLFLAIGTDLVSASFLNDILRKINVNTVIFASKHSSSKGYPIFSVHFDGNWCSNDVGGEKNKLSIAAAKISNIAIKSLIKNVDKFSIQGFDVVMEVTHHGPNLDIPSIWMEVGSTEKEWMNKEYSEVLVNSILEVVSSNIPNIDTAIGFGGTHYAYKFTKYMLENEIPMGHIMPKYVSDCVPEFMIKKSYERTFPNPKFVLIDKKGIKSNIKTKVIEEFKDLDVEIIKV